MTELYGLPVVVRTVNTFENCKFIDEIIIVAREDEISLYDAFAKDQGWKKVKAVIAAVESMDTGISSWIIVSHAKTSSTFI